MHTHIGDMLKRNDLLLIQMKNWFRQIPICDIVVLSVAATYASPCLEHNNDWYSEGWVRLDTNYNMVVLGISSTGH